MEPDAAVLPGIFCDFPGYNTIQGTGNIAHPDNHRGADFAVPEHHGGVVQLLKGCVHLFLVESSFICQADIPSDFFEEFDTAQGVLQVMDSAAQRGLGNTQTGGSYGIVLHLCQNGKIAQDIIVHYDAPLIHSLCL